MIIETERDDSHPALRRGPAQQLGLLMPALGVCVLALVGGIFLADLVFPQPTIWRLPLMIAVISAAALVVRNRLLNRTSREG